MGIYSVTYLLIFLKHFIEYQFRKSIDIPFSFFLRVLFGRLYHCTYILILLEYIKLEPITYQYFCIFFFFAFL